MFPGINGFHWSFAHILFLALFFGVVLTIVATILSALARVVRDFRAHRAGEICWNTEFKELPLEERRCRHELAGRVEHRTCPNAFDCRRCGEYERFAALPAAPIRNSFGLNYPPSRLYHRGHPWVRPDGGGTFTGGMVSLAEHLRGGRDAVELPEAGSQIEREAAGGRIRKGKQEIVRGAPIDGRVIQTGSP